MKNLTAFILAAVISVALSLVLTWWVIAPIYFLLCYTLKLKPLISFLASLISVAIIWFVAAYYFDNGLVNPLLSDILKVGPNMARPISSLIGGLVAGIFGLSGSLLSADKHYMNA